MTGISVARWSSSLVVMAASLTFAAVSQAAEEPATAQPAAARGTSSGEEPKRLTIHGDTLGVMTLAEFHKKYADAKVKGPLAPSDPFDNVQGCQQFEVRGERYGMKVATFPVYSAHYQFLDGVLFSVRLFVPQNDPKGLIAAALTKEHGMPEIEEQDFIGTIRTWNDGTSGIQLMGKRPSVMFSDNVLEKKYEERLDVALKADMEAKNKASQPDKK